MIPSHLTAEELPHLKKFSVEIAGEVSECLLFELIVVSVYRLPAGNFSKFLDIMNEVLDEINSHCNAIVLGGDFNVNFTEDEKNSNALQNLLSSYGLHSSVALSHVNVTV